MGKINPTTETMKKALMQFRDSYTIINALWTERVVDLSLSNPLYPFDKSFDELKVHEWVQDCLDKLAIKSIKF